MEIIQKFLTNNDCYIAGKKIIPKGILVHSTATPGVMAKDWYDMWNKSYAAGETNRQVCVHAFLDDKDIYQYLPWNHRGWHAGGSANNTHIGFEICEPAGHSYQGPTMIDYNVERNKEYFDTVFMRAAQLCAFLCKEYNLTEKDIITHCEGHQLGVASNHADVMHWFPKHNEDMDSFRVLVKSLL